MSPARKRRAQVRIQKRTPAQDGAGEPLDVWLEVATRRAEIVRTSGTEVVAGEQRQGRVPTVFRLRFERDLEVLPQMRLLSGGKVYDIASAIDPDGRRRDLEISAVERVEEVP